MKADLASPKHQPHPSRPGKLARIAIAGGILLLALGTRVFYAHGLPLNSDEIEHLRVAREISLRPGSFHLPLDSPLTGHPLGVIYLTALADWVGGGNVFVIRLAFIALSLLGLVGVYVLGLSLFGPRVALVALALAAADRSVVALSPVFLESPSVTFLAPWTILSMHRCLARGLGRDWLLAGLLFGLGYWLSTVFVAMLLPFGLYILLTGRLLQVLKSPSTYAGLAVTLGMILPTVIGDVWGGWMNQQRNVDKLGSIGLSPRMALLYLGDLLICLKDPTWIVQNNAGKMYLPIYVPCDWVMGLVYTALTAASLRFWRDERARLLLLVILGFMIPVTLIDAREAWNEFTWASSTVFAAIVLSALVLDRTLAHKWSKIVLAAVLTYSAGALLWFLAGPKWGYFSPEWERRYVGQVLVIELRSGYDPARFPDARAAAEIRELTHQAVTRHPESAVAWYFLGCYAEAEAERAKALARVLQLDPNNPLVLIRQADALTKAGDWAAARRLLYALLPENRDWIDVHAALAEVEYELGNFVSAAAHVRRVLAVNPIEAAPYGFLFDIYDAMGERAKAEASLQAYVSRYAHGPAAAYRQLAEQLLRQAGRRRRMVQRDRKAMPLRPDRGETLSDDARQLGSRDERQLRDYALAIRLATRACQLTDWKDPESLGALVRAYGTYGGSLAARGELGKATESYRKALKTDPEDVSSLFDLAFLLAMCPDKRLRNPSEAIRLAQRGCELTNHSDPVGLMILAAAHAQAREFKVAISTLEKALALAEAAGKRELVAELRYRLKRYQNGIAELETP